MQHVGRKYNLMTQDATYNNLLADYLRERQLHELSWMLEVSLDRPENAAISLLHQADAEGKLDEQKVSMLHAQRPGKPLTAFAFFSYC